MDRAASLGPPLALPLLLLLLLPLLPPAAPAPLARPLAGLLGEWGARGGGPRQRGGEGLRGGGRGAGQAGRAPGAAGGRGPASSSLPESPPRSGSPCALPLLVAWVRPACSCRVSGGSTSVGPAWQPAPLAWSPRAGPPPSWQPRGDRAPESAERSRGRSRQGAGRSGRNWGAQCSSPPGPDGATGLPGPWPGARGSPGGKLGAGEAGCWRAGGTPADLHRPCRLGPRHAAGPAPSFRARVTRELFVQRPPPPRTQLGPPLTQPGASSERGRRPGGRPVPAALLPAAAGQASANPRPERKARGRRRTSGRQWCSESVPSIRQAPQGLAGPRPP